MRSLRPAMAAFVVALLAAAPARAHLIGTRFGDFYAGAVHLGTALDQLVPLLAVALLAGLQPRSAGRWVVLAVPVGLASGTAFALPLTPWAGPPVVLALCMAVAGLAAALALRVPAVLLAVGAGLVGVVLGHFNGIDLTPAIDRLLYVPGVATSGFVLLTLVVAGFTAARARAASFSLAMRAVGSWIAALGILSAALQLSLAGRVPAGAPAASAEAPSPNPEAPRP